MYTTGILNNGIRVIHKRVNSDVAHCGFIINTGSRDENNEQRGIAHFIEHLLFKGTKKRKAFHVLSRLEDIGGELDAFTTKEETCISASFLSEFYERTIELFNDVVFNSVFPAKEIEKEKIVVFDEINSYKDSPAEYIFDEFEEILFPGHPLGYNILGNEKSIPRFNKKNIEDFINSNYHTDQMVFCSIGKIKYDKLFKILEKHFGQNPQKLRTKERELFKNSGVAKIIKSKNLHQAHAIIGIQAYSYFHPHKAILMIISNLLAGSGNNSRLNLSLREKHGMSYTIESSYTPFYDTGNFNIYFSSDKNNIDKCIALIYKEIKKLKTKKLGPVQLSRIKKQLWGHLAINYEINSHQLLSMGKYYLMCNKINTYEQDYKKIDSVTVDDIIQVSNELFDLENFSELIYK